MPEPEDFVICRECNKKFQRITLSHLKSKHGWTMERYYEMFPDAPIWSLAALNKISKGNTGVSRPDMVGDGNPMCRPEVKEKHKRNVPRGANHPMRKDPEIGKKAGRKRLGDRNGSRTHPESRPRGDNHPMRKDPELAKRVGETGIGRPHPWQEGDNNWMRKHPKEAVDLAAHMRESLAHLSWTTSKPEETMHDILDKLGVTWSKREIGALKKQGLRHIFDAVIEEYQGVTVEIALECDGCYWHCCEEHCSDAMEKDKRVEKNVDRDTIVNNFCKQLDVPLYRFWEHDMKARSKWIEQQIQEILQEEISKVRCNYA